MATKRIKVEKMDPYRCLVTEVLPAETPIIFSNDGLYLRCLKHQATSGLAETVFNALVSQESNFTKRRYVPYSYRIRKSALTYRNLSVVHPGAQWQIKTFYENLSPLMLHYTNRSRISIRAPINYAKTHFIKSPASDLSKFKRAPVAGLGIDRYLRHSPSYFSYSGYTRLYKFFDSTELIELEREFSCFWMIDVSKCFDSIYTHSVSWAVKDKPFAKAATGIAGFGEHFDSVMQSMNYGETSGIVIGPEFSRIFAEVILQEVDCAVIQRLERDCKLAFGKDYRIRRYVDDFFVFARSEEDATSVFKVIEIELSRFKLSVNESKLRKLVRPFLTSKSKAIIEVGRKLNDFVGKMAKEVQVCEVKTLEPLEIFNVERFALSFCNDVKLCCTDNKCEYDELSGYLISALKNRAALLMASSSDQIASRGAERYKDTLCVIIRVIFFLYSVAPSVTASYRLCTTVLMATRFADRYLGDFSASVKEFVFSQAVSVLDRGMRQAHVEGFIDLELQNLVLALSDLGGGYRLPAEIINRMFCDAELGSSYFNLATLIYYIGSHGDYSIARNWALKEIERKIGDLSDVRSNTEKAMCALDFISCPHIDRTRREAWLKTLLAALGLPASASEIDTVLSDFESMPWFINWAEIDLLNLLERKELRSVY